ncbi:hypothetical protein BOH78_2317 [Pichia kudriavzevii]|uniref:Uncharacterized protein n=1 Tax=Pichia kudriavzevii TaxID=4909 RepID=A0A1V2LN13_PICKU|nr:hypothetical protein BOH78_2317 [Pichia kudriavzevii]
MPRARERKDNPYSTKDNVQSSVTIVDNSTASSLTSGTTSNFKPIVASSSYSAVRADQIPFISDGEIVKQAINNKDSPVASLSKAFPNKRNQQQVRNDDKSNVAGLVSENRTMAVNAAQHTDQGIGSEQNEELRPAYSTKKTVDTNQSTSTIKLPVTVNGQPGTIIKPDQKMVSLHTENSSTIPQVKVSSNPIKPTKSSLSIKPVFGAPVSNADQTSSLSSIPKDRQPNNHTKSLNVSSKRVSELAASLPYLANDENSSSLVALKKTHMPAQSSEGTTERNIESISLKSSPIKNDAISFRHGTPPLKSNEEISFKSASVVLPAEHRHSCPIAFKDAAHKQVSTQKSVQTIKPTGDNSTLYGEGAKTAEKNALPDDNIKPRQQGNGHSAKKVNENASDKTNNTAKEKSTENGHEKSKNSVNANAEISGKIDKQSLLPIVNSKISSSSTSPPPKSIPDLSIKRIMKAKESSIIKKQQKHNELMSKIKGLEQVRGSHTYFKSENPIKKTETSDRVNRLIEKAKAEYAGRTTKLGVNNAEAKTMPTGGLLGFSLPKSMRSLFREKIDSQKDTKKKGDDETHVTKRELRSGEKKSKSNKKQGEVPYGEAREDVTKAAAASAAEKEHLRKEKKRLKKERKMEKLKKEQKRLKRERSESSSNINKKRKLGLQPTVNFNNNKESTDLLRMFRQSENYVKFTNKKQHANNKVSKVDTEFIDLTADD